MTIQWEKASREHGVSLLEVGIQNGRYAVQRCNYSGSDGCVILCFSYRDKEEALRSLAPFDCRSKSQQSFGNGSFLQCYNGSGKLPEIAGRKELRGPFKVVALAYQYDSASDTLILYEQEDEANTKAVCYSIEYEREKKGWISTKTVVKIGRFEAFHEGLLYLSIMGKRTRYPVTAEMLDKPLEFANDKEISPESIKLMVREEERKYFSVKLSSN